MNLLSFFEKPLGAGKSIVVWGTETDAKAIFQNESFFERIEFFVSRDFKKKPIFFGKPVYGKEALVKGKHFVIIAAGLLYKEILQELKELGFGDEEYRIISPIYLQLCATTYLFSSRNYMQEAVYIPIGKFSYFPIKRFIDFSKSIGSFVSINNTCLIHWEHIKEITTSHFLSQSGCFSTNNKFLNEHDFFNFKNKVSIGNDVWIGANTFINASKVKSIGNGAIIGTGAVVAHDVPPYAVMVGCPAKVLRYRFSPEQIECLERVKWWDWPNDELEKNADLLYKHELFFEKFM